MIPTKPSSNLQQKRRSENEADAEAAEAGDYMEMEALKENENIRQLEDIRQDYLLSLAKLTLVQFYPSLEETRELLFRLQPSCFLVWF